MYTIRTNKPLPLPHIFLTWLPRVGTSCEFGYDLLELKGTAIKYLGVRLTKGDTEPTLCRDNPQWIIPVCPVQCNIFPLVHVFFSVIKVCFSQIIKIVRLM